MHKGKELPRAVAVSFPWVPDNNVGLYGGDESKIYIYGLLGQKCSKVIPGR